MKLNVNLDVWNLVAPIRNSLESVPGRAGAMDFGMEYGERTFTLPCSISLQDNFAELIKTADNIAEWLNPYKGLQKMIFDDLPDRYWEVRLVDDININRIIRNAGIFDLTFAAPDPFGKAVIDDIFDITVVGKTEFTRVQGNIESEPLITLQGNIKQGQSIGINFNGESMVKVNGPILATEEFVLDVPRMTAKVLNKATKEVLRNGLNQLDTLEFPKIRPGINEVTITHSGGTFTKLNIKSESRWL